jgi:tetrahydromethanopterin S-methyltransferase subunit H
MKGQIRSIKELLKEIQILKNKFKNNNDTTVKSYDYKMEYEKKNIKNYKNFINENTDNYLTFDDLKFEISYYWKQYDKEVEIAELYLGNDIEVSVIKSKDEHFYSNGIDTYDVIFFNKHDNNINEYMPYATKNEITEKMIQYQKLPERIYSKLDPYGEEIWD